MFNRVRISLVLAIVLFVMITISVFTFGQNQARTGPVMRFTATTANVSGAPDSVRFDVLAWSSDADRDQMVGVWNLTVNPNAGARGAAAGARGGAGGGGGGGRGGGRGARGGGAGKGDAPDAAAGANPPTEKAGGAAAPAGGGGRGAGGGGAGETADAPPQTPEAALAAAVQSAKTI